MTSINTKTMQELEVRVSSDVFNPQKHLTPKGLAAAIPIKPQVGHHTWFNALYNCRGVSNWKFSHISGNMVCHRIELM